MRKIFSSFILIIISLSCDAQISSLRSFKHTISFLHSNFKLDSFNSKCTTCHDCRAAFVKDSITRLDTTSYKWYTGSRVLGSCIALKKLQNLLALDAKLQGKVAEIEQKYKSDSDSANKQFALLNKTWYQRLDSTIQYYNTINQNAQAGFLIEQIDLTTIIVSGRYRELELIDQLLDKK